MAATVQLSTDTAGSCLSSAPSASADGTVVVFESTCNPSGTNSDANSEIFQATVGGSLVQLTDTSSCENSSAAISSDGSSVAFESNCDLAGNNSDGSVEVFLYASAAFTQLGSGSSCDSYAPSLSSDGTAIAFESDCDFAGNNSDGNSEIFLSTAAAVVSQLTNDSSGTYCDSLAARISADGTVVVFESDCDLVGTNSDEIGEIFRVTSAGVVTQLTATAEDTCSSWEPALSADGTTVVFGSDCDFTDGNSDGSDEIFRIASDSTLTQLTDSSYTAGCGSYLPGISSDGTVVVYNSYCDPLSNNSDGSHELFKLTSEYSVQLTSGISCSSTLPMLSSDGTEVAYQSDCDPTGGNPAAQSQVFLTSTCSCGGPVSRTGPDSTLASDALFALKAAVGLLVCQLCECDVDDSGAILAADALAILKNSVGLSVDGFCQ